jgi:ATP-dependent DNA helicase RecQ
MIPNAVSSSLEITTKSVEARCNGKGEYVLKFSKAFGEAILDKQRKGYRLTHATVGHVIYWKKEGEEEECKVLVPEVFFNSNG